MSTLINIELLKIFKKWRSYIGFIAIGVMTPVVQLALYFEGDNYVNMISRSLQNSFEITGNLLNGYLVANLILQTLFVHIPFLIVLVGGDLLAGEATSGTYRILLTRPVSRFKIITSKFIAGIIYTNLLLIFLIAMSFGLSILIFGTGELIVFQDKLYIFSSNDVLWRFLFTYLYASLSLSLVMSLSFFFSSLVENAIGPIVASMAIIIIFLILSALNIDFLRDLRPYLFTTYMGRWNEFFRDPVNFTKVINSALVLLGHIIGLYLITFIIFRKKDILS